MHNCHLINPYLLTYTVLILFQQVVHTQKLYESRITTDATISLTTEVLLGSSQHLSVRIWHTIIWSSQSGFNIPLNK